MSATRAKLFWLLLAVVALCVVAAGLWPRISAWRAAAQRAAGPAAGELALQGTLARNWSGVVNGRCDFRFQLWDAEVDGAPTGDAVEVDKVVVRNGDFNLAMHASGLGEVSLSSWMAVDVRCDDDRGWETLAPRMQHQAIAIAGAAAALPGVDQSALICSVPTENGRAPVIAGANYRLEGGFRTAVAGGTP